MGEPRKIGWRNLGCLVALSLVASCSPPAEYVSADMDTYKAIAPEYLAYVQADPALSMEQKDRRVRTADAWRIRVEQASGAKVTR